jgi:hypothetical protein
MLKVAKTFALAGLLIVEGCTTGNHQRSQEDMVRINQIQVLGTHNSYAQPVDPRLLVFADTKIGPMMTAYRAAMPADKRAEFVENHPHDVTFSEALGYDHPPLTAQLNAGMRSLELDVYPDPDGGLYAQPAGYEMLKQMGHTHFAPHNRAGLDMPGFKVLHMADFDFRSHCPTLQKCLGELKAWSVANPKHDPVFILLELKTSGTNFIPGAKVIPTMTQSSFDALDQEIITGLGRERLITPDDVRGTYVRLEDAILAKAWPTLSQARGKFVFLMITALEDPVTKLYLENRPSLQGRAAFLRASPGDAHAAFLLIDNALVRKEIPDLVLKGYLVRSRADIETWEAKANDMSRAQAAFASGAQIISTDFFKPGNRYGTPYVVSLPGGGAMRCNPVNAMAGCQLPED